MGKAPVRASETMLWFSDVHAPYHDKRAVALVAKVAKALKPKRVIAGGDIFDFWKISHFPRTTHIGRKSTDDELVEGENVLADIGQWADRAEFLEGNHDLRLSTYIATNVSELEQTMARRGFTLRRWVEDIGYRWHGYGEDWQHGGVYYSHDFGRCGANAVHQGLTDIHSSIVHGHTHRLDFAVEGDRMGRAKVGGSFGWLGDFNAIDPKHKHKRTALRQWVHGFAVGRVFSNGRTVWTPAHIDAGSCSVWGDWYSVNTNTRKR